MNFNMHQSIDEQNIFIYFSRKKVFSYGVGDFSETTEPILMKF